MMTPSSSVRIGTTNPNAAMLSAICRICLREWVRTLRPLGVSLSIAVQKISIMSLSYDAEAKRTGFDLRRLQFKLFEKLRLGSYPRRSHRASAGAHRPSDYQPFWQFAVPGIAEVTSPAGIARRPDPNAFIE